MIIRVETWEAAYVAGIIDGEGSITLTRMHKKENRRPCITISSCDKELLEYVQSVAGGNIYNKKNYNPEKYKDSYFLDFKNKTEVFHLLKHTSKYLRINKKRMRAKWILENYNNVTPRNGKYSNEMIRRKKEFEETFFQF